MTAIALFVALTTVTLVVQPIAALAQETRAFDMPGVCHAQTEGNPDIRAVTCLAAKQMDLEAFAQRTPAASKKRGGSGGPPKIDVQTTCRTSENEIKKLFGDQTAVTFEYCLKQENEALELLTKNWTTYPADDKGHCAQPASYMPSYVEWLTCFEISRDVRRIKSEETKR